MTQPTELLTSITAHLPTAKQNRQPEAPQLWLDLLSLLDGDRIQLPPPPTGALFWQEITLVGKEGVTADQITEILATLRLPPKRTRDEGGRATVSLYRREPWIGRLFALISPSASAWLAPPKAPEPEPEPSPPRAKAPRQPTQSKPTQSPPPKPSPPSAPDTKSPDTRSFRLIPRSDARARAATQKDPSYQSSTWLALPVFSGRCPLCGVVLMVGPRGEEVTPTALAQLEGGQERLICISCAGKRPLPQKISTKAGRGRKAKAKTDAPHPLADLLAARERLPTAIDEDRKALRSLLAAHVPSDSTHMHFAARSLYGAAQLESTLLRFSLRQQRPIEKGSEFFVVVWGESRSWLSQAFSALQREDGADDLPPEPGEA